MVKASSGFSNSPVRAVLGPTNTGKTHLAVERMLGHRSGIIGFPLRLLAREVYDQIVTRKGASRVALVTGEEQVVPPDASYYVCTVESMPHDHDAEFLAVDEIQLARDRERGHVFTNRLLRARGTEETMFLGSDTMRPVMHRLVPEVEFEVRPRMSRLIYSGAKKLSRLRPRTAIVTFSVAELYSIADMLRRQRGGAAVVLGALSPRTRNSQVALFESGDVDFMVATDAIGMGLNMDIDHVAFASLRKFDGRAVRSLEAAELGQIAGRAGRYMSDGTFGTTADAGSMRSEDIKHIENHSFAPVRSLYWRNSDLDFKSLGSLIKSLESAPSRRLLLRVPSSEDMQALKTLGKDPVIADRCHTSASVQLLWRVCQIPDFRKTMADDHARLLGQIFLHLTGTDGCLPQDWFANQLVRLERTDGDIDTLSARIAHVRTWTYVSHRSHWLYDACHWQERARIIEDKLSDALHERLTQRFFDRRVALLVRRLRDSSELNASVEEDGEVIVEGIKLGRMEGLRFVPEADGRDDNNKALRRAANRVLNNAAVNRSRTLANDNDSVFALTKEGHITWQGAPVARLNPGSDLLAPRASLLTNDLLDGSAREQVRRRIQGWVDTYIAYVCRPVFRLRGAELSGIARGLAYHLSGVMGVLERSLVADQLRELDDKDRARLRLLGVRFAEFGLYLPEMLKPQRRTLAGLLWAVSERLFPLPPAPEPATVSFLTDAHVPRDYYLANGFYVADRLAVRADMLDRFSSELRKKDKGGSFSATPELMSLVGCTHRDFHALLKHLGYRFEHCAGERTISRVVARDSSRNNKKRYREREQRTSPFALMNQVNRAKRCRTE